MKTCKLNGSFFVYVAQFVILRTPLFNFFLICLVLFSCLTFLMVKKHLLLSVCVFKDEINHIGSNNRKE